MLDPPQRRFPCSLRNLALRRALAFVLHDDGARCHLASVAHLTYLEGNEVEITKLAVNIQVEEGKFSHPVLDQKLSLKRPDILA